MYCASFPFIGIAKVNLDEWSTNIAKYRFPSLLSGKGPVRSAWMSSPGSRALLYSWLTRSPPLMMFAPVRLNLPLKQ